MGQQNQKLQRFVDTNYSIQKRQKKAGRRLPLEMECEIFKCLAFPLQCKFIWGTGRGIYGIFAHKLLIKCTRLRNRKWNYWYQTNTKAIIYADGLKVHRSRKTWPWCYDDDYVFAVNGFPISTETSRKDNFPGAIVYYFEVKRTSSSYCGYYCIALSDLSSGLFCKNQNYFCYEIPGGCSYCNTHKHYCDTQRNIHGCGLVLNSQNKLSIFVTLNGKLERQIPLGLPAGVDYLYPTVIMRRNVISLKANFGNNPAKPFKFDTNKFPGLVFE